MINTFDEANTIMGDDIVSLDEKQLNELIEFLIRKGLVAKMDKSGASFEWSEATKNILLLFKHLIVQIVTKTTN